MNGLSPETYLGLIAIGLGVGTYGTLIGAGGGFVLMPLLLLFFPNETPEKLTSISLAIVFLNALSGSGAYALMRRIDYKSALLFAVATIPGAIFGALNTGFIPRRLFDVIFGILLVGAAVFLNLHPGMAAKGRTVYFFDHDMMSRHLKETDGTTFDYAFNPKAGVLLSLFIGYISSFLGIGGGIIHVPALVYLLHFPVHVATATSHLILAIMAFTGTVVHILTGTFPYGVHYMISLGIGVLLGAQIGARLSRFLTGNWIIRSLAAALGLVGIRILFLAV
ncbi:MAG: sulfite exporter TauE/SafE family protein [Deltaproteobacteria bacterium]|nr:sulfite exporter TauE/SafE family protein [Deltaproteobacteria bacterium]